MEHSLWKEHTVSRRHEVDDKYFSSRWPDADRQNAMATACRARLGKEEMLGSILSYDIGITVLQYYSITVLQHYSITALQYYSITVLQYCSIAVLQYCSITVLQYYSITVLVACSRRKKSLQVEQRSSVLARHLLPTCVSWRFIICIG